MKDSKPLPSYLVQRYHGWKATSYDEDHAWYERLASEGQRPRALIISCCDSRVIVTSIFGADQGEFFVHRNIANFVPPNNADGEQVGTAAAIEYAVTVLKVSHIMVLGHSCCGGVKGCHDMCQGNAPALEDNASFVGRWVKHMKPGFERTEHISDEAKRLRAMEYESVLLSLENLVTYPFVRDAIEADQLSMHGLWTDIGTGALECYDVDANAFVPV